MTKKEMAKAVAENMKKIRPELDIEKQTKVLMKGMTTHELTVLLNK